MVVIQNELQLVKGADGKLRIAEERLAPSPRGQLKACLFIHGYNVSEDGAGDSFNALATLLERIGVPGWFLRRTAWLLLWRAYASLTPAVKSPVSFASYPLQVDYSTKAAHALASYIRSLSGAGGMRLELVLIAHSLGSRLVLEALRLLAASDPAPRARVRTVFLMAPAVPVALVEKGRRLRAAVDAPDRTFVLYSSKDRVLGWAFRVAQGVEKEAGWVGWLPRAVGATGLPVSTWSSTYQTHNGHSGYFRDHATAVRLAEALGWSPPWRANVRHTAERPPAEFARLAERSLASRVVRALRRPVL